MSVLSSIVLVCALFGYVTAHMGISSPVAREKATVGDAYRYPNAGHCHGVPPGDPAVTYAAGQTVTLTLSSGAAHNGGHCALFLAQKSDNEQKWYKQMDVVDCTVTGSISWVINANLVPSSCSDGGCSLIWGWTPTSSGACEIYMNCFNVKITGAKGGSDPTAVTINKNPPCSRVDGAKRTAHFGEWCGTECGGMTAPPTAPGATEPPTVPAMVLPNRCGTSWIDANSKCNGAGCKNDADCSPTKCFADMTVPCSAATNAPTLKGATKAPTMAGASAPTMATAESNCRAVGAYASISGMTQWCIAACATGVAGSCPSSHCKCDEGATYFSSTNVKAYVPKCQIHTSDGTLTIEKIAEKYDLSSYQPDPSDTNALKNAASELLTYNKLCKPALKDATIETTPASDLSMYITGDCEMTDLCVASGNAGGAMDGNGATATQGSIMSLQICSLFACLMFIARL